MYEFCPLCSKRGFKRRIKALQINCHEAVWACEEEECEWPFGYKDFVYISREAGSTWSCYWDDSKPPLQTMNECVPVSTELSLYTPPETPGEVVIKDCTSDVQSSDNDATTNNLNNIVAANEVQITNIVDISNHSAYCLTNNTSEETNIKIENLSKNDTNNSYIEHSQDVSNIKDIPKDVLIKTQELDLGETILISEGSTCIGKSNLETDTNKIQLMEKNKDISVIKNTDKSHDDAKTELKEEGNNFTEKNTSCNLKITTVKIDGLPPVILSYEAPASLSMPPTVSNKGTNFSTTQCVTTLTSRRVSNGQGILASKQYAKFSFNAIKKKMQATNNNDSLSSDNKRLPNFDTGAFNNEGTNQTQKEDPSKSITSCSTIDTNKFVKKKIVKTEPKVLENTSMDSNLNLDTLLDDIMKDEGLYDQINENHELSDIDEDWINSLLY